MSMSAQHRGIIHTSRPAMNIDGLGEKLSTLYTHNKIKDVGDLYYLTKRFIAVRKNGRKSSNLLTAIEHLKKNH